MKYLKNTFALTELGEFEKCNHNTNERSDREEIDHHTVEMIFMHGDYFTLKDWASIHRV